MKVKPILSPEDQDLCDPRWYISGNGLYPQRAVGRSAKEYLHRLVLARKLGRPLLPNELADHINGNRLDCRRENLRATNAAGNSENITTHRPLRGATLHKCGKWQAQVQSKKGQKSYLGLFATAEEAAQAAKKRREELGFLS